MQAAVAERLDSRSRKTTERNLKAVSSNPVLSIFFDVHMGMAHPGLAELARAKRLHVERLLPEQYVVFMNCNGKALKIFAAGNTLVHLKVPEGKVSVELIESIPTIFGGRRMRLTDQQRREIETSLKAQT